MGLLLRFFQCLVESSWPDLLLSSDTECCNHWGKCCAATDPAQAMTSLQLYVSATAPSQPCKQKTLPIKYTITQQWQ